MIEFQRGAGDVTEEVTEHAHKNPEEPERKDLGHTPNSLRDSACLR
jgi:hypothetical protein